MSSFDIFTHTAVYILHCAGKLLHENKNNNKSFSPNRTFRHLTFIFHCRRVLIVHKYLVLNSIKHCRKMTLPNKYTRAWHDFNNVHFTLTYHIGSIAVKQMALRCFLDAISLFTNRLTSILLYHYHY